MRTFEESVRDWYEERGQGIDTPGKRQDYLYASYYHWAWHRQLFYDFPNGAAEIAAFYTELERARCRKLPTP